MPPRTTRLANVETVDEPVAPAPDPIPEPSPVVEGPKKRKFPIAHEYNGNNHRIVIGEGKDAKIGEWFGYAQVASLDQYRATSDDKGERIWVEPSNMDFDVVREGKVQ